MRKAEFHQLVIGLMNTLAKFAVIALTAALTCATSVRLAAAGPLVADSVAEFSGHQGLYEWSYGYYDGDGPTPYAPDDFEPFPLFDGNKWLIEDVPSGYWTRLTAIGGHPNGIITTIAQSADHWAVRRWTSVRHGLHTIAGVLADDNSAAGLPGAYNGVVGRILIDGAEVWSMPIDEGGSVNYMLALPLSVGSIVDFAIDARKYLNQNRSADWTDSTTFTAQIFVPEPAAVLLLAFGWFGVMPALRMRSSR
jgi:hypothetical protein